MEHEITVLEHFEKIVAVLSKNGLCKDFYLHAKDSLKVISSYLETTQRQAALFAVLLDNFGGNPMPTKKMAEVLKCKNLELLRYLDDLETLKSKKLIKSATSSKMYTRFEEETDGSQKFYFVPQAVINSVRKGEKYIPKTFTNLNPQEFFDCAADLLEATEDDELDFDTLETELYSIFEQNKHISFVKSLGSYNLRNGSIVILIYFCCELLHNNNEIIQLKELYRLFGRSEIRKIERRFETREHKLIENELIQYDCKMGIADTEYYRLTSKAKKEFLADVNLKENSRRKGSDIIHADSIKAKELFYSEKIDTRISELCRLLSEDNFANIQKRLETSGMRTGFPCIFSGPPGTGKTETVYQIGRRTGRDIFLVDIAETKSAWFGESEKRIKAIFDRYKGMASSACYDGSRPAPILLFNEADAILGKRRELSQTRSGPGQTENAIQNIILSEMENLNGILIATTNLTVNLDTAFERRFLYKIEFEKPDTETRAAIWQTLLPAISSDDAACLAAKFDFSGGQIENISRKCTVDHVLSGQAPSLDRLISFCEEELLNRETGFKIGFIQ